MSRFPAFIHIVNSAYCSASWIIAGADREFHDLMVTFHGQSMISLVWKSKVFCFWLEVLKLENFKIEVLFQLTQLLEV